jgi:hypothetical protein
MNIAGRRGNAEREARRVGSYPMGATANVRRVCSCNECTARRKGGK